MAEENATSVHRVIAILTALGAEQAGHPGGTGVSDIARLVGREKSQVSRTLKVLDSAGFVERDEHTLGYRLGWRLFTLATCVGQQRLLAVAPRFLRRLTRVTGERTHLSALEGGTALTLYSESPRRALVAAGWVGRTSPLHCTSSGRALLFDYRDEELHALMADAEYGGPGPKAPRDRDDFLDRLRQARRLGHALVDEEFDAGLLAVAAPVRDFNGRIVAAVNVSGPTSRLGRSSGELAARVRTAARELSRALAGTGPEDARAGSGTGRRPEPAPARFPTVR